MLYHYVFQISLTIFACFNLWLRCPRGLVLCTCSTVYTSTFSALLITIYHVYYSTYVAIYPYRHTFACPPKHIMTPSRGHWNVSWFDCMTSCPLKWFDCMTSYPLKCIMAPSHIQSKMHYATETPHNTTSYFCILLHYSHVIA